MRLAFMITERKFYVEIMENEVGQATLLQWEVREVAPNGAKWDGNRWMRSSATTWDVYCTECAFMTDGRNGLANASQHHDRTGHFVVADAYRRIEYGG